MFNCLVVCLFVFVGHPDMTFAVDWALKPNYLYIFVCVCVFVCLFWLVLFCLSFRFYYCLLNKLTDNLFIIISAFTCVFNGDINFDNYCVLQNDFLGVNLKLTFYRLELILVMTN